MAGTWTDLTNAPPATVCTTFLLTDGTVLAQGVSTNKWYRLTPDANGSYANGTWATMADSVNGPLYYASGILRDGRLIVAGGEYNFGALVWLKAAEMYNPVANTWTTLPTPAGWNLIGDAPGCVLPDGRFFLGEVTTTRTAIYDPATNAWTAAANKLSSVGEESWSFIYDGSVHAVDCSNPPNAEKYVIAANTWVPAGATPQVLVDSISEIGASVLLPDGRLFVIGATGFTAIYTVPPIANQPGTWVSGPTIPQVNPGEALGTVDAPAVLLPNGRVLFSAGPITVPATFQSPTYFFEFDPESNTISAVPRSNPINSNGVPYFGRMLMLPTGQVLYTHGTTTVELYTPDGTYDPVWRPTITGCPKTLRPGVRGHQLSGRQINGLSQCVYYGNDATQATNYPIVRLESMTDSRVVYCRTFSFSTMGLQTGTVIHNCRFTVPSGTPLGAYRLIVIANGIPSAPCKVQVTNKFFKELKMEIKEKNEILELHKRLLDVQKNPNEFDIKIIREEFDLFERYEEEWLQNVRDMSTQLDDVRQELSRSFIRPEERPEVGPPLPQIEPIEPRRISAAEGRIGQIKRAFNDGRKEQTLTKEADVIRQKIHNLSTQGGGGKLTKPEDGQASKKSGSKRRRRKE
ncbi:MAG TPA: hypothetical protein VF754_08685 [Pyrinomonadaceae bacterium]